MLSCKTSEIAGFNVTTKRKFTMEEDNLLIVKSLQTFRVKNMILAASLPVLNLF
jgi:hypothetical protein